MTDTTHKAPDRIWVQHRTCTVDASGAARILAMDRPFSSATKYIRDDLVQAAVAAKLREAAEQAEEWGAIVDHPSVYMGGPSRNAQRIAKGFAEEIRALITPDAQAALDRVVEAERERGFWAGRSCGGSKAEIDAALNALCQGGE